MPRATYVPEIQRIEGIGQVQLFGSEQAMRVSIDPAKLEGFQLSSAQVIAAIRAQNAQVSSGAIGDLPGIAGQGITATVTVRGQLYPEEFGNLILRANTTGGAVSLESVAALKLAVDLCNHCAFEWPARGGVSVFSSRHRAML